MQVLLVAPQPFFVERGTPIAVRLLAETLSRFGHQVDLLVYHAGEDLQMPGIRLLRAARPPGVRHVPIGISWQKLACDVTLVLSMLALLVRNKYQVVHAVEEAVFPAAVLAPLFGAKFVYDMDSSLSEQLVDKWRPLRPFARLLTSIERVAVRRASLVLPVCDDLAIKVRPWVDGRRVVVLPDVPMADDGAGAEVESIRRLTDVGGTLALYVGNLERYQGIDLMLEAMAQVPEESSIHLVIIGGAEADLARYRKCLTEMNLEHRVSLLGPRPLAHLGGYLRQADVLVSPRMLGQNTPMKIYSYMQSGKAILATRIRSHTQALDDQCAELVDPEPQSMADGLQRLANDPARRDRVGASARMRAESEYSPAAFRQRLEAGYALLAGG